MWVRADGAFEPVIDLALFSKVRQIIQERSRRLSDDDLLGMLQRLLERRGVLSGLVIDECEDMPSSSAYRSRFGSLLRAYQLVGYRPRRDYRYIEINRALRRLHSGVVDDVICGLRQAGGVVERDPVSELLTINGEFSASVVIARCRSTPGGALRWRIRLDTGLRPDVTVAVRMDEPNRHALDYYLLPRIDMTADQLRLAEENGLSLDAYRFETLDFLFSMAGRADLREAA
jgi:hypothetical protein